MNPTDIITKLRKLTVANKATVEEERRAAEKIGRLLMAHPEISVGGMTESAKATTRAAPTHTDAWSNLHATFSDADWNKLRENLLRRTMSGTPPEGWDAWIRARARTYD